MHLSCGNHVTLDKDHLSLLKRTRIIILYSVPGKWDSLKKRLTNSSSITCQVAELGIEPKGSGT